MAFLLGFFAVVLFISILCYYIWTIAIVLKILNVAPITEYTYGTLFLYLLGLICLSLICRYMVGIFGEHFSQKSSNDSRLKNRAN